MLPIGSGSLVYRIPTLHALVCLREHRIEKRMHSSLFTAAERFSQDIPYRKLLKEVVDLVGF